MQYFGDYLPQIEDPENEMMRRRRGLPMIAQDPQLLAPDSQLYGPPPDPPQMPPVGQSKESMVYGGSAYGTPPPMPPQMPPTYQPPPPSSRYHMKPRQYPVQSVPRFERGGKTKAKQFMVGEDGPELVKINKDHAEIIPLPPVGQPGEGLENPSGRVLPPVGPSDGLTMDAQAPMDAPPGQADYMASAAFNAANPTGQGLENASGRGLPVIGPDGATIAPETEPAGLTATEPVDDTSTLPANPTRLKWLNDLYVDKSKFKDKHWSKWDKIAAALHGWATGGIFNAIEAVRDKHYFERQRVARDQADLLPQIQMEEHRRAFDSKQAEDAADTAFKLARPDLEQAKINQRRDAANGVNERAKMNIDFRKGVAKPYIDANGKVWKQFLNNPSSDMEPLINPVTHVQEFVPGEEGIEWTDPNTGAVSVIKAKQSVMPSATIATGNVNRTTDVAKFNAQNQLNAQKETVNNILQWQNQNNTLAQSIINADTTLQNNAVIQGLNAESNAANQELQRILAEPVDETDEKQLKERADRVNKFYDKISDNLGKITTEFEKIPAGQAKAAQLRQLQTQKPPRITFTPITAATVGGGVTGKPVPKSKDPLGLYQ